MSKPKLKRDWVGRQVRTLRELRNGNENIRVGTVLTVKENRGGLHLVSERCPHCGVSVYIRGVPEWHVQLLAAPDAGGE